MVVIEDDPHITDLVDLYLRQAGFRVHQAADAGVGLIQLPAGTHPPVGGGPP